MDRSLELGRSLEFGNLSWVIRVGLLEFGNLSCVIRVVSLELGR